MHPAAKKFDWNRMHTVSLVILEYQENFPSRIYHGHDRNKQYILDVNMPIDVSIILRI